MTNALIGSDRRCRTSPSSPGQTVLIDLSVTGILARTVVVEVNLLSAIIEHQHDGYDKNQTDAQTHREAHWEPLAARSGYLPRKPTSSNRTGGAKRPVLAMWQADSTNCVGIDFRGTSH